MEIRLCISSLSIAGRPPASQTAFPPKRGARPRGKSAALAILVLGILAGERLVAQEVRLSGFLFIVFDPELLMS